MLETSRGHEMSLATSSITSVSFVWFGVYSTMPWDHRSTQAGLKHTTGSEMFGQPSSTQSTPWIMLVELTSLTGKFIGDTNSFGMLSSKISSEGSSSSKRSPAMPPTVQPQKHTLRLLLSFKVRFFFNIAHSCPPVVFVPVL